MSVHNVMCNIHLTISHDDRKMNLTTDLHHPHFIYPPCLSRFCDACPSYPFWLVSMPSCCCDKRDHPEAPPPVDYPPLFYQFKQHGPNDRSSSDSPVRAPESPVEQSSRSTEPISTTSLDSKPHGLNTHSIFLVKKNGRKTKDVSFDRYETGLIKGT